MHHLTARPDVAGEKNRPTLWENKDNQGFLSFAAPPFPLVSSCSKPVKCMCVCVFLFFFSLANLSFFWDVMEGERDKTTEPGEARYAFVFTDGGLVDNWKGSLGFCTVQQGKAISGLSCVIDPQPPPHRHSHLNFLTLPLYLIPYNPMAFGFF